MESVIEASDLSTRLDLREIAYVDKQAYNQVLQLRQPLVDILFKNGVDAEMQEYLLEGDDICRLFILYESREAVGTATIRPTPEGFMFEWIVIRSDKKGLGYGSWVTIECIKLLKGIIAADQTIYLHSTPSTIGFYEKLGFFQEGEEFFETVHYSVVRMVAGPQLRENLLSEKPLHKLESLCSKRADGELESG